MMLVRNIFRPNLGTHLNENLNMLLIICFKID